MIIKKRQVVAATIAILGLISVAITFSGVLSSEHAVRPIQRIQSRAARQRGAKHPEYTGPRLQAGRDYDAASRIAEIQKEAVMKYDVIPDGYMPVAVSKQSLANGDPEIRFCKLDFETYSRQPSKMPLSKDFIAATCQGYLERPLRTLRKQATVVQPTGFIFHESRVGSTLVANMLAADPDNLVYSESSVPPSVALHCDGCSEDLKVDMLRLLVNAMGNSKKHKRLFLKLQSINSPELALYRRAFPTVPFIFLFRNPVETMMSHFKQRDSGSVRRAPCIRSQSSPPHEVLAILGDPLEAASVQPEKYCAAHLRFLCESALALAKDKNGMLLVNYDGLIETFFSFVLPKYFKLQLSETTIEKMRNEAQVYSKARSSEVVTWEADGNRKRESASDAVKRYANEILQPVYERMSDIARKQKSVEDMTLFWDRVSVESRENQMYLDSLTDEHLYDRQRWTAAMQGGQIFIPNEAKIKVYEPYPELKPLKFFLDTWPPDKPDIPDIPGIAEGTLQRFDYSDPKQRAKAEHLRNHEVPFMLTNVPNILEVKEKWTEDYLARKFGESARPVTYSDTNHFPYFNKKLANRQADYKPPTGVVHKTFREWLEFAKEMDHSEDMNSPHWYFQVNGYGQDSWIANDIKVFKPDPSFFIVEPNKNRGINCRFGMKGIVAETHYDGGRNFVAMLKGAKRYVLLPPSECPLTYLYPREHPEARHSKVDWSNFSFSDYPDLLQAKAAQVIVRAGEVLYIPSYWFHYIVSTGISAQCNTRSGNALRGRQVVGDCGFY